MEFLPMPSQLTNPNRILYPDSGITKQLLAAYYESVQNWMLPYIQKRPLTLVRCPQGQDKDCFYQKHIYEKIPHLYQIDVQEKNAIRPYLYLKDVRGIVALVQLGVLEIHLWNCKIDNIEKPDMIIFDLDPGPDVVWKRVVKAAYLIREQLEKISLKSFVKTTGGKGLHIVIPIRRYYGWDEIKLFSQALVDYLVSHYPKDFVGVMTKSKRTGKIFIDYLRNQRGATSIAPYSTRARIGAPIATPLSWTELETKLGPTTFTLKNLSKRLSGLESDPWKDFLTTKQSLKL